jgi:heme oxygenase
MEQHKPQILMNRLKQETEALHRSLEKFPFFNALSNGTLPLASYVNQLRAFATAYGTLEHESTTIPEPSICAVLGAGESRFSHLLSDLACFGETMIPEIIKVKRHADAMASRIRLLGVEYPVSLMGYVYVLQGTILGNRVHLPDIQRTFKVGCTNGAAFYAGYGDKTDEYWAVFATLMNSFDAGDETAGRILTSAREAFAFLKEIHTALFPLPAADGMIFTSTSLNPEAGNHAVPEDEREIAAAIIAGRLCREEFPYFDERYGERGKRFTDSDAAWLATLARLTPPLIISQVAWLGGVLASRGMPRVTLERLLFYLHEELVRAVPDKQTDYDQLMEAVTWLKKERLRHISAETFDSLCHAFATKTDNELGGKMKETGSLIVSAVSDEKAGIAAAVPAIEAWLTDSGRYSAEWITAVRETIARARSAVI